MMNWFLAHAIILNHDLEFDGALAAEILCNLNLSDVLPECCPIGATSLEPISC